MTHEELMKYTIKLSVDIVDQNLGGPFACIVVKDGEIISEGWNSVTSDNDPTAHAEINTIRKACKKLGTFELKGCDIYTSCEPCPMCFSAIYWARIDNVFYSNTRKDAAKIGFDDDLIYNEIKLSIDERIIPFKQLLREEALIAFEKWENKSDKIKY